MSRRSAQSIVQRLVEKEILTVHFESLVYSSGHFYRFSNRPKARVKIAKWLGVSVSELRSAHFFARELNQPAQCAEWAALLRDTFPDGKIWRDQAQIRGQLFNVPSNYLGPDHEMVPDFVLSFDGEKEEARVSIGFEVERSRKLDDALGRKLGRFVNRSKLDGVVYVCETGGVSDAIGAVLDHREILFCPRLRQYPLKFVLFTDRASIGKDPPRKLVNVEGKSVSLEEWVAWLRKFRQLSASHADSPEYRFTPERATANENPDEHSMD